MIRVVKLGGSLLETDALIDCLQALERYTGRIVIVPGGGEFAEQVRREQQRWGFDDVAAHRMAILAMQQMALLFHSLKPAFALFSHIDERQHLAPVSIWSPTIEQLDNAGIAASWDVTSDSLAAWLAGRVAADELLLVKSAEVAGDAALDDLRQQGVVDPAFVRFAALLHCKITVINKDRFLATA